MGKRRRRGRKILWAAWGGRSLGLLFFLAGAATIYLLITYHEALVPLLQWRGFLIVAVIEIWLFANGLSWGFNLDPDRLIGIAILIVARIIKMARPSWSATISAWVRGIRSTLRREPVTVSQAPPLAKEFDDLFASSTVMRALNKTTFRVVLGHDGKGRPVLADLDRMYNIAIFGPTRSGKTYAVRGMVASLLAKPGIMDMVDFAIFDLKGDLSTLAPLGVYTMDVEATIEYLEALIPQMTEINALRVKYNVDWWWELPVEVRPKATLVVLDESQQTFDAGGKGFRQGFAYVTNTCAANGVVVIATGLYPRDDLFPRKCLANFHARGTMRTMGAQECINLFGQTLTTRYTAALASMPKFGVLAFHDSSSTALKFVHTYPIERDELKKMVDAALFSPQSEYHWIFLAFQAKVGGAEKIMAFIRERLQSKYPGIDVSWLHKRVILDTLWHFVRARVAIYHGARRGFELDPDVRGIGDFTVRWQAYVDSGGLDRPIERGEDRGALIDAMVRDEPVQVITRPLSRLEQAIENSGC